MCMISNRVKLQSIASPVGGMSSHVLDSEQWFLNAHPRSNSGDDRVYMGSKQNENNKEHCFHKVIFFIL